MESDDTINDIVHILRNPRTDDPVDVLREIAEEVGLADYSYFDGRGQWVLYPPQEML